MIFRKLTSLVMRLRTLFIPTILLSVFLIFFVEPVIYSQATDSTKIPLPRLYFGISIGMLKNQILNEGDLFINNSGSEANFSFSGSVEFGYYFSKSIGISTGLGFSSYIADLSLDSYQNTFNTVDTENESYEKRVSGSGISETQKLSFLNIPVLINLRLPSKSKFQFFLQTGVSLSLKLSSEYTSNGTFTYTGYYPAYNALLQDLPAYGFESNKLINSTGSLETNPMIINGLASAGFQYFVSGKIQIAISGIYSRSLTNISGYTSPESFQLSSDPARINSMMGGSTKTTTESLGASLSVRYYFK